MWLGSGGEMCVDLMRYHRDGPDGVMDALFAHLFGWGKANGYHWFALGMAPLSGFEQSPVAPLWSRLGSFLYKHGEALYGFQGLRDYKEKVHPAWEPRYLVYPGGLRLASDPRRRLSSDRGWLPPDLREMKGCDGPFHCTS